jgi:hypothetical protein
MLNKMHVDVRVVTTRGCRECGDTLPLPHTHLIVSTNPQNPSRKQLRT